MRIGINALQVRAAKSGAGQYLHGLLGAMLRFDTTDEFIIYTSEQNAADYDLPAANLHNITWGLQESARAFRLLNEYARLPSELSARRISVFHGPSNYLPVRKVCPYVVTVHDLAYYVQPERCPLVRRHYWYALTMRTMQLADAIITDSESSQRDIQRFFPATASRISVIYPAPQSRFRRLSMRRTDSAVARRGIMQPYVLYVGALEPGKNVSRIIAAFDHLAREFPDHLLLIAGDRGWMYEQIFRTAEAVRRPDRIHFLGHIPETEVPEFLNFCDAFVFPSLYEGFGLPVLEALACGAPVITSNTSALPEVVGEAALTVNPYDTKEISEAIRRLLVDREFAQELGKKAIDRARAFSWDDAAQRTLQVYRKLASSVT